MFNSAASRRPIEVVKGDSLSFPTQAETEAILSRIRKALRRGRKIGEKVNHLGTARRALDRYHDMIERECQSSAAENSGVASLLTALCYLGIYQASYDTIGKITRENRRVAGYLCSVHLANAVMNLPTIWTRFLHEGEAAILEMVSEDEWKTRLAGATAHARVVSAFRDKGCQVIFASPLLHLEYRIDLIVNVPGCPKTLQINVDGDGKRGTTDWLIVPESGDFRLNDLETNQVMDEGELERFSEFLYEYSRVPKRIRNLSWPLYIRVGLRGAKPGAPRHETVDGAVSDIIFGVREVIAH